ncbi:MAG: glutathione S-transferase family protein [Pseudomonadota bacterium]
MGELVNGKWEVQPLLTTEKDGKFRRRDAGFRNWITPDGSAGPSGTGGFKAEAGRYHLYISHACPWAHRTLIFRHLKGLDEMISLSVVDHFMGDEGWHFSEREGAIPDAVNGASHMWQIYVKAKSDFSGRVTVPVLWDKETGTIVSNESSEIIRMFNSAFDGVGASGPDYYPEAQRSEIDTINDRIYHTVNNGVYKSGFARSQSAYDEAVGELFETLDMLEERLGGSRYLVGNQITEADWRLFTTLVRFDPVYVGHFKCNIRRIADYPNLSNYTRDLFQVPGVADLVNLDHIKKHYYGSHETVNPTRIVPMGPDIDYMAAHDRDRF